MTLTTYLPRFLVCQLQVGEERLRTPQDVGKPQIAMHELVLVKVVER
jgi:hypothetical protein